MMGSRLVAVAIGVLLVASLDGCLGIGTTQAVNRANELTHQANGQERRAGAQFEIYRGAEFNYLSGRRGALRRSLLALSRAKRSVTEILAIRHRYPSALPDWFVSYLDVAGSSYGRYRHYLSDLIEQASARRGRGRLALDAVGTYGRLAQQDLAAARLLAIKASDAFHAERNRNGLIPLFLPTPERAP